VKLLERADKNDLVISIICGGGSALFCRPGALTCLELQFISSVLLRAGATIQEINTVRKHVSLIHGGYMAKYAYPATVLSLIISDVPGDDLQMVSSGPTVMDRTSKSDAERVAHQYGLPPIDMMETPKDQKYFKKVNNVLIACGAKTVDAMAVAARELGYLPRVYSRQMSGLAKDVGAAMAETVKPGEALLACGETEVIVTRPGMGGRNQDLVLSALPHLAPDAVVISAASDGKDNVPVAGAIADGDWSRRACARLKINPAAAVADNRSYKALHKLGDHLTIEKVTANISDFVLVLRGRA
jgi:glycerate-2-kinase